MTPEERRTRVYELFDKVVEMSRSERRAYLDEACIEDPREVRDAVERLLEADEAAYAETEFLKAAPVNVAAVVSAEQDDPMIGERIGHYLLKERLGQGGFGSVYLALRSDDYEQQVAVKVVAQHAVAAEEDEHLPTVAGGRR